MSKGIIYSRTGAGTSTIFQFVSHPQKLSIVLTAKWFYQSSNFLYKVCDAMQAFPFNFITLTGKIIILDLFTFQSMSISYYEAWEYECDLLRSGLRSTQVYLYLSWDLFYPRYVRDDGKSISRSCHKPPNQQHTYPSHQFVLSEDYNCIPMWPASSAVNSNSWSKLSLLCLYVARVAFPHGLRFLIIRWKIQDCMERISLSAASQVHSFNTEWQPAGFLTGDKMRNMNNPFHFQLFELFC